MLGMQAGSRFVGGAHYAALNEQSVRGFLAALPVAETVVGGDPSAWTVSEVGDGNLNLVFIVKGGKGGIVVKQALPYVRMVGESWPLPLDRAYFEHEAMQIQTLAAPRLVPKLFHFDTMQAATVMELLEPHLIVRKGLIKGIRYPKLAPDVAEFCAQTLFSTSDLGSPAAEKRERQARFSHNITLSKITEDLVFTDPYRVTEMNRWTSPQLDKVAAAIRQDAPLKLAAQELKWMFLTRGEALLHGDLHTGSIMATATDTRVIDPEFAVFGPMGFDLGAFMANLLLSYFSQEGHATRADDRIAYRAWLLDTVEGFWTQFEKRFLMLWEQGGQGDAFIPALFTGDVDHVALQAHRAMMMTRMFQDALGFTGAKMIRRILGLAHVEDLESIADADLRARCEKKALRLARALMVGRASLSSIHAVKELAEEHAKEPVA